MSGFGEGTGTSVRAISHGAPALSGAESEQALIQVERRRKNAMWQDPLACTTLLALWWWEGILGDEDAGGASMSVRGKTRCAPAEKPLVDFCIIVKHAPSSRLPAHPLANLTSSDNIHCRSDTSTKDIRLESESSAYPPQSTSRLDNGWPSEPEDQGHSPVWTKLPY